VVEVGKSLTKKLFLKKHLYYLCMQKDMSLRDHLDQLNKILLDLRNVEIKVDDEDVALILLMYLPSSYETFVDSYIGGKETLTLEDTKSTLLMREDRQNAISSGIESQTSGLATIGSKGHENSGKQNSNHNHKSLKSKGSKSDDICHYCKEKGHWRTECPKLKRQRDKKEKNDKRKLLPLLHKLRLILKKTRAILKEI